MDSNATSQHGILFDAKEGFNREIIVANFMIAIRRTFWMFVFVMLLALAWIAINVMLGTTTEGERNLPKAAAAFGGLWTILFAIASLTAFPKRTYRFSNDRIFFGHEHGAGLEKATVSCVISMPMYFGRVQRLVFYDRNYRFWFDIMVVNDAHGRQRISALADSGYSIVDRLPVG